MEPGYEEDHRDHSRTPSQPYSSPTLSHFATGFGPVGASLFGETIPNTSVNSDDSSAYSHIFDGVADTNTYAAFDAEDTNMLNEDWHPYSMDAEPMHSAGMAASPLEYTEPPVIAPSDSYPVGTTQVCTAMMEEDTSSDASDTPQSAVPRSRRRAVSVTYSSGEIDHPLQSVQVSPRHADSAVTYYGAYHKESRLHTRELLRLIPIPSYSTTPINLSDPSQPSSDNGPINLSRYLRKGVAQSKLVDFQEFVTSIIQDDALTPEQRAMTIEDRAEEILETWGKLYLSALITSAHMPTLTGDLASMLKPFEDSIEVTVLLAMASQYDLSCKSKEEVRKGWRSVFNNDRQGWYDSSVVTPAIENITVWFNGFLIQGCDMARSLTSCAAHFKDLARCIKLQAWGEVSRILLELAASGGYLHHFRLGPPPPNNIDPQTWDMDTVSTVARICLILARKLGPVKDPTKILEASILLFRHLSLCSITTWLLSFFAAHGLVDALEQFIAGTNPLIESPEVPGNYVPPWAWVTAVSSGFMSVVLAGMEELGYLNSTGAAIVSNADLMQLMSLKIQCTRALLIDLWVDESHVTARNHIVWVSKYNMIKGRWATSPRLETDISSLYVSWNPASVVLSENLEFRRENPDYRNDFLTSYRRLAEKVNKDVNSTVRLPYSQEVADVYEKCFGIRHDRFRERLQNALDAELMDLSARTSLSLGPELTIRVKAILLVSKERALREKQEANLLQEIDEREHATAMKALEVRNQAISTIVPRGIQRPKRRDMTLAKSQSLPSLRELVEMSPPWFMEPPPLNLPSSSQLLPPTQVSPSATPSASSPQVSASQASSSSSTAGQTQASASHASSSSSTAGQTQVPFSSGTRFRGSGRPPRRGASPRGRTRVPRAPFPGQSIFRATLLSQPSPLRSSVTVTSPYFKMYEGPRANNESN